MHNTVGEDEWALMRLRTVPIVLRLDPQDVFYDVGLDELYQRDYTAAEAAIDAAESAGDPAAAERAEQLWLRVEELHEQDLTAYHAAYAQSVRAELVERGVTVAFQLRRTTITHPVTDPVSELVDEGWLADRLHEVARERTPLPATGLPRTGRPAPPWPP